MKIVDRYEIPYPDDPRRVTCLTCSSGFCNIADVYLHDVWHAEVLRDPTLAEYRAHLSAWMAHGRGLAIEHAEGEDT